MSTFSYQSLKDTTRQSVIKITGEFTAARDESDSNRIMANNLGYALDVNNLPLLGANTPKSYYGVTVERVFYDVDIPSGYLQLYWSGSNNNITLLNVSGNGDYNGSGGWGTIQNSNTALPGCNGNIGVKTVGANTNNSYTVIIHLKKDSQMYDYGQFRESGAFNYGTY